MGEPNNTVYTKYNVLGDDIYYHHTLSTDYGDSYQHIPEAHMQYEILYLIKGELVYFIDGESYRVNKGDMIFIAPNEIHSLEVKGAEGYERAVLLFEMDILGEMMKRLGVSLKAFSTEEKNSFHVIEAREVEKFGIGSVFMEIVNCNEAKEYKRLAVMSRLINLVVAIDKLRTTAKNGLKQPYHRDSMVSAINGYVEKHMGDKITLDDISEELFVSKSTLCHKFVSYMGITVNRYVAMKKIYRAATLLKKGISARAVSELVGYESYTSFFYNYKKIMGKPPKEE